MLRYRINLISKSLPLPSSLLKRNDNTNFTHVVFNIISEINSKTQHLFEAFLGGM